jgi:hypothetical protein
VIIFDLFGKEILGQEQTNEVDISNLAAGVYFIRISNEQGQLLKTEKMI